jgi:putative membrane protein
MLKVVLKWLLSAAALLLVAYLVPGIHVGHLAAIVAAIVIGLINAVLRPILIILTLPITILTLGLFILVINAALFMLAAAIVPNFTVHGWRAAIVGSILYAVLGWLVNFIVDRVASRPTGSLP